ncbi:hypothetical protein [Bradyrhizobium sp. SZCCHNRI1058]|uniref:hypothetical protein n=1 Tax=Bradyrhizobium sp. SZCCHNRI1058 TaxID=3057279 RepID=UPI002916EA2A|nr:hypothetical protein [Bradyrhizobium sp. SZCCHNRI1058]
MTVGRRLAFNEIALLLFTILACSLEFSGTAAAASCLRDDRAITFPDGSSRIRSYICKLDNSNTPQVRIEFHRLGEAFAGTLLENIPNPDVARVLGNPKVLNTSTGTEAKKLFDSFGSIQNISSCFSFDVQTPKGGSDYQGKSDCGQRKYAFFSTPGQEAGTMPLPDDNAFITAKSVWPPNYNFFYLSECGNTLIGCTVLWRPVTPADIDNYKKNWHRQNKIDGVDDSNPELASLQTNFEKYFQLTKHLMRDGWQNDFLTITGTYDECGGFNFSLYPRQLILDVATIENISAIELKLDGILATESSGGMRKLNGSALAGVAGGTTINTSTTLRPGQKVLAPVRMTWSALSDLKDYATQEDKGRRYAALQKAPQGKIFSVNYDNRIAIRKTRESFGAPLLPPIDDMIYGPALDVTGIIINGATISLNERSRNYLQVTASDGAGSCPFLYAQQPRSQAWDWYGKVIHQARLKANEIVQQIPLAAFASRFRISEEELEISHLDYAAMTIVLADGNRRVLKSSNPALQEIDGTYAHIPAGTSLEFGFDLPPDVDETTIKQSWLAIRGYYEPYSRLRIDANLGGLPLPHSEFDRPRPTEASFR